MNKNGQVAKSKIKDLVNKFFMVSPVPMIISREKDGIYIEANKSAVRLWGLPRKQVIGHQSTELGIISPQSRKMLMGEIRKKGLQRIFHVTFGPRIKAFFAYYLMYFR